MPAKVATPAVPPINAAAFSQSRRDTRDRLEPAVVSLRRTRIRGHGGPLAVPRPTSDFLRDVPPAPDRGSDLGLAAFSLNPPGTRRPAHALAVRWATDRKSTRLNSSHGSISYAVFCL